MGESAKVGKRGAVVIPAKLRKKFGIEEGSSVLVEEAADGVLIRPAVTVPIEIWSPERKAAFLLENAVDPGGLRMGAPRGGQNGGLDPDRIPHGKPKT